MKKNLLIVVQLAGAKRPGKNPGNGTEHTQSPGTPDELEHDLQGRGRLLQGPQ